MDIRGKLRCWFMENALIILFVVGYSFIITMQNICNPISEKVNYSDGAIYQYIGHLITIGKMPYLDAFDHKGPLLYLINSLGCVISVKWGIWIIDFAFMIGIITVSYKIANTFVNRVWSVIICIFIYSDFLDGYWIGNTPDYYSVLFVALSLYLLIKYYLNGSLTNKNVFVVGVLCSCAFWLKQTTIISILALCFLIIVNELRNKKMKDVGRYILWFISGFAVPTIVFCAWVVFNNTWDNMLFAYFTFNFGYTNNQVSMLQRVRELFFLSKFSSVVIIWILIAVFLLYKMSEIKIDNKKMDKIILHTSITLVLSLIVLSMPGRNYSHYNLILYPLLIIIASAILNCFQANISARNLYIEVLSIIVIGLVILLPNLKKIPDICISNWTALQEDNEVLNYIKSTCHEGDMIAVATPDNCGYYLESGFESATTYPYIQADMYGEESFRIEYRMQIQENTPRVIVWNKNWSDIDFLGKEVLADYYIRGETDNFKIYATKKDDVMGIHSITDINEYLQNVSGLKNCVVFFVVKDIQGYSLTNDIIQNLTTLGFDKAEILLEQEYHSFIGIYSDENIYQDIGDNEAIFYTISIEGRKVSLASELLDNGNRASVCIDGIEYAINQRGINIVVYDKISNQVIDSVAFDTHVPEITCFR